MALLINMNYSEFLQYIFQRRSGNIKLGLERITGVLNDMENPQSKLRGIHIGGTNGKGSTSAACEALLLEHGLHVGLNTSPHLIDYCERFRVDGKDLEFKEVLDVFHRYEPVFSAWDASFFEITTAIAFKLFEERNVNAAVIEAGLGGRLDATNLFLPDVSAVTTIGLDHVEILGGTHELIAFEEAGIIKDNTPVILGNIDPSPMAVIMEQAERKKAEVYAHGKDFLVSSIHNAGSGISFNYRFRDFACNNLSSNLPGRHQSENLSIALTAFLIYCLKTGISPIEQKIRAAFANVNWKGRFQLLQSEPTVIVDGAHNLQGIEALIENLKELFPGKKVLFAVSILADKDYKNMLKALCPHAKRFYISKNESDRAAEIKAQADVVTEMDIPCKTFPTVRDAILSALADADKDDIIIGAGSLYTVAEILGVFEQMENNR